MFNTKLYIFKTPVAQQKMETDIAIL